MKRLYAQIRILPTRRTWALTAVLLAAAGGSAHSAYDRPVSWSDISSFDLKPVFRSDYASDPNLHSANFPPSAYEIALNDADELISRDFRVPAGMREHVAFWLRVYTEFSSRHIVIHDDRHPEVVYEVLDFRELAQRARNRVAYEVTVEQKVRKVMANYRAGFDRLARNPRPKRPTETESRILEALAKTRHRHSMREFRANLRSQTGQRDHIIRGLLAAEAFFPKMERIFTQLGVPSEITRLSLVESSFNLNAVSRVGATGVWQFMHKSGLEYLMIDPRHEIDERLSPIKSTVAAAKLLRRGNRMLKSWPLAITSYHNGYRGLTALAKDPRHRANPFGFLDLCGKRSPIGWASKNYYAAFLAVLHAESYRHQFYGSSPELSVKPVAFRRLTRARTGAELALERGIPLHDFRFYNPDVRNLNRKLPVGFWYAIPGPSDEIAELIEKHSAPRTQRI
jgi:membrane-bound lytic murein transglycosylase D